MRCPETLVLVLVLVLGLAIVIVLVLIFVPWSGCDCWLSIVRQSIDTIRSRSCLPSSASLGMSTASLPELLPAIEHDDDCESEHEFGLVRAEARYSEPFPLISGAA
jgi:hypothetical protein